MSDYPETLVETVAKAVYESICISPSAEHYRIFRDDYMGHARAALDALGLREESGQHFASERSYRFEIVKQRRYVTAWRTHE